MAISHVTRSPRRLVFPPGAPPGEMWVYQLAQAVQLGPNVAGLMVNIRRGGMNVVDLEVGNDMILFDDLDHIDLSLVTPLSRSETLPHPRTGEPNFLAKYPASIGFVPAGARRADGSPHPHAGTGFGLVSVLGMPADLSGGVTKLEKPYQCFELQQYTFDGATFRVTETQVIEMDGFLPGWTIYNRPIGPPIPDGDDFVAGIVMGAHGQYHGSGMARWRRTGGAWRLDRVTPITDLDGSFEPSIVRDRDGSLVACVREAFGSPHASQPIDHGNTVRLWRSTDGGESWQRLAHVHGVRASTPVSVNRAADGLLYVASNPDWRLDSFGNVPRHSILLREVLQLWPLSPDGTRLGGPVVIRDCNADFGLPPGGTIWYADHPISTNLRLADGRWHHVVCYRCLEQSEGRSDAPPTRFTGCYVEEVVGDGAAEPAWRFADGGRVAVQ
ncbi:MAG: sialidase family protein [Planctomycetota bacterium]|nr:sialidase family protein [Planctomycetota bacterium]